MSNNDSLDEETKRILAEVDSDDSKESNNIKKDEGKNNKFKGGKDYNPPEDIRWETNTEETPDSEW